MRFLYIGQYTEGTTSKMRSAALQQLLGETNFSIIDTNIPLYQSSRIWRSVGFRYKRGPIISRINDFVLRHISGRYNLIWIDKAIYLTKSTTQTLRSHTDLLVHFTPDPAFLFHASKHFRLSIGLYDFAVTSKSYELEHYKKYLSADKVLLITQGYDKEVHYPRTKPDDKKSGVVFIGHFEKDRGELVIALDTAGIPVSVAGRMWDPFIRKNPMLSHVTYLGQGIYGEAYPQTISDYWLSPGLLSRYIPELHTTRTFEIPACGTILLTEANKETTSIFTDQEAVFYHDTDDLINKIKNLLSNPEEMNRIGKNGYHKVTKGGYDYNTILQGVLHKIGL